MKKLENFSNCLNVLKNADFDLADNNDIYRTGMESFTGNQRKLEETKEDWKK